MIRDLLLWRFAHCSFSSGVQWNLYLFITFTVILRFHSTGVVGLLWYLVWLWLTFEKPSKHPCISARELKYIEQSLGQSTAMTMPTIKTTPWRAFFHSMPVYAIIVANFCRSWNFYMLVLFQARYLQETFNLQIAEVRTPPPSPTKKSIKRLAWTINHRVEIFLSWEWIYPIFVCCSNLPKDLLNSLMQKYSQGKFSLKYRDR